MWKRGRVWPTQGGRKDRRKKEGGGEGTERRKGESGRVRGIEKELTI